MTEATPLSNSTLATASRSVHQNRWLRGLPRVLFALTALPTLLLVYALWQSQSDARIGADINRAGSLRYRSLWQYGAAQENAGASRLERRDELETMRRIREELREEFPRYVAETDAPFNALANEIKLRGRVSWNTANQMRNAANALTEHIDEYQQARARRTALWFGVAIVGMALSLPLTLLLSRHLQHAERQLSDQNNALTQASARFAALFADVPVACYRFDADGRIGEWNRACEEVFGLSAREATGRLVWETITMPENREAALDLLQRAANGERLDDLEWEYYAPFAPLLADEPKHLLSSMFPFRDGLGESGGSGGGLCATIDITARKRAERDAQKAHGQARISEERVRIVADSAAVLLMLLDETGGLIFTNQYWRDFTGRTIEQERGQGWMAGIPAEDRERCDPLFARAFERRETVRMEHRLRRHDGVYRWLAVTGAPRYENGEFVGYIGSAVDITERKDSENEREEILFALLRSEARLAEAQRLAHLGSWEVDLETSAITWSDEVFHFYGFPPTGPTPTLGEFRDLLGPDETAVQETYMTRALQTGEPYERYQTVRRADGLIRHGYLTAAVEQDEETGKAKRLFGTLMDVTEQREAEIARDAESHERERALAEREEASRALQASEARLRHMTERAHCLLWQGTVREKPRASSGYVTPHILDKNRNTALSWDLTFAGEDNGRQHPWLRLGESGEARERIARLSRAAGNPITTQTSPSEIWYWSRDEGDRARTDDATLKAFRAGDKAYEQEFRFTSPSDEGGTRWVEEKVQIERISPPDALGEWRVVGVCVDITERKKAEARLEDALAELKRSNESLSEFASIASHDLKEPLRKIQMFGGMLERKAGPLLDDDTRSYLTRMLGASERMQALIAGLLDYSRVTVAGRKRAVVDLNEVTHGVLGDLEARIADVNGVVDIGPLPTIHADALQMRQLFQNLISNALKFHRPGTPPIVTVRARLLPPDETPPSIHGAAYRITVVDNGIGFDAARHADKVFGMFERLEGQSAGYEGTGVGLAICRKIVLLHGGAIQVQSAAGAGATFTIDLPIAPE